MSRMREPCLKIFMRVTKTASRLIQSLRTTSTKPSGSTTCPACGMPYNLSDYRADAPKIFCSHCRTELPRTRPMSLTDDWPVVHEGVWLYAGTTPVAVRILLSSETCGTGDYEDEESAQQNQDVECYFLAYEMPGAPGNFCNQVWDRLFILVVAGDRKSTRLNSSH